jgi:hypothetical protein
VIKNLRVYIASIILLYLFTAESTESAEMR